MSDTTSMVKVLMHSPDGDAETLWATPVGENRYRLENSPFFAYGVSWLDVVEAAPDAVGQLVLSGVVQKSGHRTVRVIFASGIESAEARSVLEELVRLGCSYEGYNPRYVSVDVPPEADLAAVAEYLTRTGQRWEYADPTYAELFGEEEDE